jgi:PilZ domain-containing protein
LLAGLGTGSRIDNRIGFVMLKFEKRYLDRLKVPGAEVEYNKINGDSAKVNIIDLTKISIRFYIKHTFEVGELVRLKIFVKDHETIDVKGNVVWTQSAKNSENNQANAVVQLLPFGTDESINSLKSYEQLTQLAEEYSVDDKITKNIYKA